MMKKYFALLSFVLTLVASCSKNPDNPDLPDTKSDTTKILTLVEYDYNNGNIVDSTLKNLVGLNGPSGKQFIITAHYSDEAPDITTYNLNLQNQLLEIDYTYGDDPTAHDRDIFTWSGNNLSQIENQESGTITHTYNFTYTSEGPNTRITYTEIPQQSDTVFGNDGHIIYHGYNKSAFIVSTADFKPVGKELYHYDYIHNTQTGPVQNVHDTLWTSFVLSSNGDLRQEIVNSINIDSNANDQIGKVLTERDSTIYNYARNNNDNEELSNVLKSLFGNQLYVLSSFYNSEFGYNELLPEIYHNYFFINHPLNKETSVNYSWSNGVLYNNGLTDDPIKCENSYDNQNRLLSSQILDSNNKPEYGFKIIWP